MRRLFHIATAAVVAAGVTLAAQPQATIVLKNGERRSGALVYHNDANFTLVIDGREQAIPQSDIALVDFTGGTPAAAELQQLPGGDPAELERNMIVLKDGSVVHGKLYTIKTDGITVDTTGGRRDFGFGTVSRIYMNGRASRNVYASVMGAAQAAPAAVPATSPQTPGGIVVQGTQAWTETGITVRKGERLTFSASGQVAVRNGGDMTGPDGSASEVRSGVPVPALGVGGLIGRVGTSAPFPIGSGSTPITMPASGRLYLGVNDANTSDNSGAYSVTVIR